jgi:hypothetical protein
MAIIHLVPLLLAGSCDLPESHSGTGSPSSPIWSCSVWGLPCPGHHCPSGALLPRPAMRDGGRLIGPPLFTLAGPDWNLAVCFLWHFPYRRRTALAGIPLRPSPLASTLPCGVRTFLSPTPAGSERIGTLRRGSDRPACSRSFYDSLVNRGGQTDSRRDNREHSLDASREN